MLEAEYKSLVETNKVKKHQVKEARNHFDRVMEKLENKKRMGQTVQAWLEEVLKDNGINMRQYLGGNIQGNGHCKFMSNAKDITNQMVQFLMIILLGQKRCSNK